MAFFIIKTVLGPHFQWQTPRFWNVGAHLAPTNFRLNSIPGMLPKFSLMRIACNLLVYHSSPRSTLFSRWPLRSWTARHHSVGKPSSSIVIPCIIGLKRKLLQMQQRNSSALVNFFLASVEKRMTQFLETDTVPRE